MKKIDLLLEISNKFPIINDKDPLYHLITTFDDIKNVYNGYDNHNKIFYFNKENIHKILYDEEKILELNKKEYIINSNNKINLSELFYLSLLILDSVIINYKYPSEYLTLIFNYLNNICKENFIQKIILSKILLILIDNLNNCDDNNNEKVSEMKNTINQNLRECINSYCNQNNEKKIKIDTITKIYTIKKIDTIYSEIIIFLITENKFSEYEYCINIIKQLDLENINITSTILKRLDDVINKGNEYMKNYIIKESKDLLEDNIINFFYIFCKLIFKNPTYIYQNDFLRDNFKNFKKLLNGNIVNCSDFKKKQKISELIKFFHLHYSNNDTSNLPKDSKSNFFESLDNYKLNNTSKINIPSLNNINSISDSSSTIPNTSLNQKFNENVLKKIKFKINISSLYRVSYENISYEENKNLDEEYLNINNNKYINEISEKDEDIYKNYKGLLFFISEIENLISISKPKYRPVIKCKIERNEEEEKKRRNSKKLYYMNFYARFKNKFKNNKNQTFKDEDILVNSIDSKSRGFIYLINELCNDDYSNIDNNIEESISDYSDDNNKDSF